MEDGAARVSRRVRRAFRSFAAQPGLVELIGRPPVAARLCEFAQLSAVAVLVAGARISSLIWIKIGGSDASTD